MNHMPESTFEIAVACRARFTSPADTYLSDEIERPLLDSLDAAGLRLSELALARLGVYDGVKPLYGNLFTQYSRMVTRMVYDPFAVSQLFTVEGANIRPLDAMAQVPETGIPVIDTHHDILRQLSERALLGGTITIPPSGERESELHNERVGPCKLADRKFSEAAAEGTLENVTYGNMPFLAKTKGAHTMINLSEVHTNGVKLPAGWIFAPHYDSSVDEIDGLRPIRASAFMTNYNEATRAFRTINGYIDEADFTRVQTYGAPDHVLDHAS